MQRGIAIVVVDSADNYLDNADDGDDIKGLGLMDFALREGLKSKKIKYRINFNLCHNHKSFYKKILQNGMIFLFHLPSC